MLSNGRPADPAGVAKAIRTYGDSVLADIDKARTRLLQEDNCLATCMARMQMSMPEPELRSKIRSLLVNPQAPAERKRPD